MDLVVFYSPDKACITYYINNDSAGYKIEYPFAFIKNTTLDAGEMGPNGQPSPQQTGGLVIELTRPPNFFMDSSGSGGFYQCGDFTEDQQASKVLVHHLGGHPKVLSGQLAKLVSLESFQNRLGAFDPTAFPVSAPVSLGLHRPASQPNHLSHPQMRSIKERQFGTHLHPNRGHRRQRSRSVPLAVDFSALQHPMPTFHFQQQQDQALRSPNPNIFAPIPQHQTPPGFGSINPNLRIDTSSGYGMEFRPYPLSATTTASPSDYASPAMFSSGPTSDSLPAAHLGTPYGLPFMSPLLDPSGMMGPSMSPLSAMSHGDPVIANQSPPLTAIDRSASAELFPMHNDSTAISDDGMSLTELYSKQSLSLTMPSPGMDSHAEELAMQGMITFDTIDPSSLSPDHSGM